MTDETIQSCIEACLRGARACEHVMDTCVKDPAQLADRLRLTRDCADICWTAAAFLSRDSRFAAGVCRMCAEIAEACGEECAKRELAECRQCANVCRQVVDECRRMAAVAV